MPILTKLRHPGVRTRHWEIISKDISFKRMKFGHLTYLVLVPADEEFTLGYVLQLHLENHQTAINNVTDVAINEFTLETALDKMNHELVPSVVQLLMCFQRQYSFHI